MKIKLLSLTFLLISAFSFAQIQEKNLNSPTNQITVRNFGKIVQSNQQLTASGHVRCSSEEYEAYLQAKFPNRASTTQFEAWLAPKIAKIKADRAAGKNIQQVYNIPVVIHIVHNGDAIGTGENITDAQAISQITVMNEDYRRIMGTPGGANTTGLAVDCEINFCLAQTDPNGNATSGIVRHNIAPYSNNVSNGSGGADWETMNDVETLKSNTIWDPEKYLNMWTIRPGGLSLQLGGLSGLLGYAQFPNDSGLGGLSANEGGASTDGVVAGFNAFGTIAEDDGTFILNSTYNLGRTMTHEVGHWLGLRHIWGDGNCSVDDYCADTPVAAAANYDCDAVYDSCSSDPGNDMTQNYMDYTYDNCMDTFTQNQKDRMVAVMTNSPRRGILNASLACQAPAPYIQFGSSVGSINETNNCNYTDYNFPLTISKAPTANATVTFTVSTSSTATPNKDYNIVNSSVTFASGSTTPQNLTIRVYNDGVQESDETIIVDLSLNANGGDAELNPSLSSTTLTIVNDDTAPSPTATVTLLNEDFESVPDWSIIDQDGDSNYWGIVNGLGGYGTSPNTITGKCAYSEKRLSYLGGSGNATPNNYLISPQITIPANVSSATLSYIIGGYDNSSFATRNAGNYLVYFTTDASSQATITSGTVLQTAASINEGTTELKTHDLTSLAGQTGYIVFRHQNNASLTGLLLLDTVLVEAVTTTSIQTEINTATRYEALLNDTGVMYTADTTTNNHMLDITSSVFDYDCVSVEVDRSQTSVANSTTSFISPNTADAVLAKTFRVNAANATSSENYSIVLYYTEAEVAAWETATGKNRSQLKLIKVANNSISTINSSNFYNYVIEEVTPTIGAFGTGVTFTASFTSGIDGGYTIGSSTGIICGDIATTWNGSVWSNGTPLRNVAVTFTGNYSSSSNIEACSITVSNNAEITINSGDTFIVNGDVTVDSGSNLTIENNGALRQIDNLASNTGSILVKQSSTPMIRLDYTAWSSPVSGQQLLAFSPNTVTTRFYEYLYTGTSTATAYQSVDPTTNFIPGKGYMIRVANNWSSTVASAYNGEFSGTPNNGVITQSAGPGYNLVGNPYASPIDADTFLDDNTTIGTVYFWTNTTPASGGIYQQNNFASYNKSGYTSAYNSAKIPNGFIGNGQGFYIHNADASSVTVTFNNAQRVDASATNQFFKTTTTSTTSTIEKHRFWLNLNDSNNTVSYCQTLVGYIETATNGVDIGFDGKIFDHSKTTLYSLINNDFYIIQGKTLPFTDDDIVPLGINIVQQGDYTISLGNFDGLFTNQTVYLKDKYLNNIHNLNTSDYQFNSNSGQYNDRFEIVYKTSALNTDTVESLTSQVYIATNDNLTIHSTKETIEKVEIFNTLGQVLYRKENANSLSIPIENIAKQNQVLLVNIYLSNGKKATRKVIF